MKNLNVTLVVSVCAFLLFMVLVYSDRNSDEACKDESEVRYCQMVDIFKASKGENGWPDYKQIYSTVCEVPNAASKP